MTKEKLIENIYTNQKRNSKRRKHNPPAYSLEMLKFACFTTDKFEDLYRQWVDSSYDKDLRPSVDRKDDNIGYTLKNIQLCTLKDNINRYYNDVKIGINNKKSVSVSKLSLDGELIYSYASSAIAGRENCIDQTSIIKVCKGKRKTAGGFKWEYL